MASIDYPIENESLIAYLKTERDLREGGGKITDVAAQASVPSNARPYIEVTIRFDMDLPMFQALISQQ